MLNINSLKFLSDRQTLYIMITVASIILLIATYCIGYYNQPSKDQVCLDIRQDRDRLQERVFELENQRLKEIVGLEKRIKSVQDQICRERINKFKVDYKSLRCKICNEEPK
ncbi:hypothetical protein CMI37_20670 [Candidatus Pacearchaeota archaeon]|nr:hypothetical protein [Candidatus Pacearchaeota archaeon]